MLCQYTRVAINRRFGVPVVYSPGAPLQLTGVYASVGVVIRKLISNVTGPEVEESVLRALARVGDMIGRPLNLTKNEKGELVYSKEELSALTSLAALDAKELEINGGKYRVSEYFARDKTFNNDAFKQYGQTEEEMNAQKARTAEKKAAKRAAKYGKKDEPFRIFYFGLDAADEKGRAEISRISAEDLNESGFLTKQKEIRVAATDKGIRICLSGGSTHNKEASRKWYGSGYKNEKPIKGDAVIILTNGTPLDLNEIIDYDEDWLKEYKKDRYGIVDPVDLLNGTVVSKKQKTN